MLFILILLLPILKYIFSSASVHIQFAMKKRCYRSKGLTMFRIILLSTAALALSSTAFAHPEPETNTPEVKAQKTQQLIKPQLPSQAEISEALEQMPDMNAIMGDMMGMMKDEKFRGQMEETAKGFAEKMDAEDVFKKGPDGMPDFNKAFASMLGTFSDEETMGGMMGMMGSMMELAETMEKHIPEDAKKAAPKP